MFRDEASWLEIDLAKVMGNLSRWKTWVNLPTLTTTAVAPVKVCAVVKANAYGLGVVPIAQALEKAEVDMLAVYSPLQALELLQAGLTCPLLVLMPMHEQAWELTPAVRQAVQAQRLHLVINDPAQTQTAQWLGEWGETPVPVHLHVDTGMSRAGLSVKEVGKVIDHIGVTAGLRLIGVMSHLATAHTDGSFDEAQHRSFVEVIRSHPRLQSSEVMKHLSATAGACRGAAYHFDMVRIGLGMWGYGPELRTHRDQDPPLALEPVVRWRSRLVHVQHYHIGDTVGYGRTHQLKRDSLLGVVATGYGDGYPLSQSNRGRVMVQAAAGWQAVPVLGRVSMDQIVVDLTDLATISPEAISPGTLVELLSADKASPCALPQVASRAETSEYEILCRLSPRLPRHYRSFDSEAAPTIDHAMQP